MRVVKTILKAIVYIWATVWAALWAYIFVGVLLGKLNAEPCKCGGVRATSKGKLYGWMFR